MQNPSFPRCSRFVPKTKTQNVNSSALLGVAGNPAISEINIFSSWLRVGVEKYLILERYLQIKVFGNLQ